MRPTLRHHQSAFLLPVHNLPKANIKQDTYFSLVKSLDMSAADQTDQAEWSSPQTEIEIFLSQTSLLQMYSVRPQMISVEQILEYI